MRSDHFTLPIISILNRTNNKFNEHFQNMLFYASIIDAHLHDK